MTIPHIHVHPKTHGDLQPNSHMCFVCGIANIAGLQIRFYSTETHQVEAEIVLDDRYQGYPGIAHGGVMAAVLDETMGRAALSSETPDRLLFTGKMEVRYRKNVPLHTPIRVRGWIVKDKGRVVIAQAQAIAPDGTVLVETEGMMMEIPAETLAAMNTPEVGWRVYDDSELD